MGCGDYPAFASAQSSRYKRAVLASDRLYIRACYRQPTPRPPVWFMRQAGRYMVEYRDLKDRAGGFWGLCTHAEYIAEATLFAQRALQVDAAIIFSDITMPAWGMGMALDFAPGPCFPTPIRTRSDVAALATLDPVRKLPFLMDGIRQTRAGLSDDVSLIGFVGAPLTLAGYMIEGKPSPHWLALKQLAYGDPDLMHALLVRVSDAVIAHAQAQVEAGCDALQLFDTTAGDLAAPELYEYAFAYAARVIDGLRGTGVPITYFARNVGAHLEQAADVGAHVLGVDWSVKLDEAFERVGDRVAVMGNLDPAALFLPETAVLERGRALLAVAGHRPGYIFNLGHGVLPETPVSNVKKLAAMVRQAATA